MVRKHQIDKPPEGTTDDRCESCGHKLKFHDMSGCREHGCRCDEFTYRVIRGDAVPDKRG